MFLLEGGDMTPVVTTIWTHGNAVVAEHRAHLLALEYRG